MNDIEITFKRKEIVSNIDKLQTFEEVRNYITELSYVYYEVFYHKSDNDIEAYFYKYGLSDFKSIDNDYHNYINELFRNILEPVRDFKYLSLKFSKFQKDMDSLIRYTRIHLLVIYILENKILKYDVLRIKESLINAKLKSLNTDEEKLKWLREINLDLWAISSMFSDFHFKILYEKFNLYDLFPLAKDEIMGGFVFKADKYFSLKNHVDNNIYPIVKSLMDEYELKVSINVALKNSPDNFESLDEKFPLFNFDYKRILKYSDAVFKTYEEKAEYNYHIICEFNKAESEKIYLNSESRECVEKLKDDFDNLKSIISIRDSQRTTKTISVSVDTSKVTDRIDKISNDLDEITKKKVIITKDKRKILFYNHYLNVAFQMKDIPRQNDLITKMYNKTFISRKFKDNDFIVDLAEFLKSKLEDNRFNDASKAIITHCKNYITNLLIKDINEADIERYLNHRDELHNISGKSKKKEKKDLFKGDDDMKYLTGEEGIME